MTLVRLADTRVTTILIDCHIRAAADNPNDDTPNVGRALRERLIYDKDGRPFVDAFLLSHPDQDHCGGLRKHFWLGHPDDYPDDDLDRWEKRIIIRELWSSPLVFRRRSKNHTLCDDASAFNKEARRRVKHWRDHRWASSGNRIQIMGEDVDDKTDDLRAILVKAGEWFSTIDGSSSSLFRAQLLAPAPHEDDAELEEALTKNESSVVMNMEIAPSIFTSKRTRFLVGGDAEVLIWERMWDRFEDDPQTLAYDLLLAPHHCSWHTLSWDSWSGKGENAKVSEAARNALGQAKESATIISSSKTIVDDANDPPCIRAKREYQAILKDVDGWFACTEENGSKGVLELEATSGGSVVKAVVAVAAAATSAAAAAAPRAGAVKK
ncbi:metallohydrolase [Pseudomonas sp. MM213]|uniref:metallohydrolase n=1 Tax=Pseudomonas sp. MM213 TaxID=2866807 RepID=UPI001CF3CCB9|nr:metallohydrolase [Pseudomonas sp. MM213]UCP11537.1 metallohydrolase [Pseudomonas sp. MM213]